MSLSDDFGALMTKDAATSSGSSAPQTPAPTQSAQPAQDAPTGSLSDVFSSVAAEVNAAKPAAQPAKPDQPHETMPMDILGGAVEPIATMATGALGGLIGGAARLGSAAFGSSYDDAKATGNKIADALTYHPQTQGGQQALAGVGNMATGAKNALMSSPVGPSLSAVGNAYNDAFVKGAPNALMATINDQVPTVTANLVAPAAISALRGAPNALRAAIESPSAVAERVEPSMPAPAPKPNYVPNGDGTFTQKPPTVPPGAAPKPYVGVDDITPQPGSAQGASPTPAQPAEISLSNASPELRAAIANEKGPIDSETLGRHLEADSLPVPVSLTKGQATQDINQLSAEQNMRGKAPALAQRFNEQNGQLIQNADAIRDSAAPDVTATNHIENGQSLIDAYKAKDAALSADISQKYKALEDANGGQFPVDGPSFVDAANQALAQKMKASFLPPEVRSLMDGIKSGDQPMNFQNFEELRTTLAAAARKAERAGDGNQAMAVSLVRNSLESLPMTAETAAIKPLADAARSAAKARFDLLGTDPAYKAAVNDTVAPDDFIQKFVVGGKQGNLQAMKSNLADDPLAQQTISSGAMNWLKSKAGIDTRTNTGNFSQAGYNKGLSELAPRMGEIFTPETAQQVQTLGNVARYTQAQPRGSYVNNSNTFVAQAAHTAAGAVEGAANVAAHGIPVGTWVRNALTNRMGVKEVEKILKPGAGVSR